MIFSSVVIVFDSPSGETELWQIQLGGTQESSSERDSSYGVAAGWTPENQAFQRRKSRVTLNLFKDSEGQKEALQKTVLQAQDLIYMSHSIYVTNVKNVIV